MSFRAFLISALLALGGALPARSAILLEGVLRGQAVTAETAGDLTRVVVTVGKERYLVEPGRSLVRRLEAGGPPGSPVTPADDRKAVGQFTSSSLGGGVMVGDHAGTYQLVKEGERLCAEALTSAWMIVYTRSIAASLELLERLDKRIAPKPWGGCSSIRFTDYAEKGWPLLAGHKEETVFRTTRIRFDHKVDDTVLALLVDKPPAGP